MKINERIFKFKYNQSGGEPPRCVGWAINAFSKVRSTVFVYVSISVRFFSLYCCRIPSDYRTVRTPLRCLTNLPCNLKATCTIHLANFNPNRSLGRICYVFYYYLLPFVFYKASNACFLLEISHHYS